MAYFRPVIDELRANPAPEGYLDYLRLKLRRVAAAPARPKIYVYQWPLTIVEGAKCTAVRVVRGGFVRLLQAKPISVGANALVAGVLHGQWRQIYMQVTRRLQRLLPTIGPAFLIGMAVLASNGNLWAQQQRSSWTGDETTITGKVISSTRNTLVVRDENARYWLFTFDLVSTKPVTLKAGSQVRVTSYPSDDPSVRVARYVAAADGTAGATGSAARTAGEADATGANAPEVVPAEVRTVERQIERDARRFRLGARAGMALDPELLLIGVQSQIGPFFTPNLYLRPNVEFGFGEVTALFALNLEAIYRLPITTRSSRVSAYFGVGPGFNFIHHNFEQNSGGTRIDFGDFHSDTALNILGGVRFRSGVFTELKTSVYANPAPTLRLVVGYNF